MGHVYTPSLITIGEREPNANAPSDEALFLADRLEKSPIGILILSIYRDKDVLDFPDTPSLNDLCMLFEVGPSKRSIDWIHLTLIAKRPDRNKSIMHYNRFADAAKDIKTAIRTRKSSALATLDFLWILARVLGVSKFANCYEAVLVGRQSSQPGLDTGKLEQLHRALKLLLSSTSDAHWEPCDDETLEDGVDWWCKPEDGEELNICKNPFSMLIFHEKTLLPCSQRDLWVAKNLSDIFGAGSIVESAQEDDRARKSSRLWRCDPSPSIQHEDSCKKINISSREASDWKNLPVVLIGDHSERVYQPFDKTEAYVSMEETIEDIVDEYESDNCSYNDIEEIVAFRLILGKRGRNRQIWHQQIYFNYDDETRLLQMADRISTWTKRFLKTALTYNRAIILFRHTFQAPQFCSSIIPEVQLGLISPLHRREFRLMAGPVIWHRIARFHASEEYWDCLQIGRLLWDFSTERLASGWNILSFSSDLSRLNDDFSVTVADAIMLLAYVASISFEQSNGEAVPIPMFQDAYNSVWWQSILPPASEVISMPGCANFRIPIEENIPPFTDRIANEHSTTTVVLVKRSDIRPISKFTSDRMGITWERIEIDLLGLFNREPDTYNLVVYDDREAWHNLMIGPQSVLMQSRTAAKHFRFTTKNEERKRNALRSTWEEIIGLLGLRALEHISEDISTIYTASEGGPSAQPTRVSDTSNAGTKRMRNEILPAGSTTLSLPVRQLDVTVEDHKSTFSHTEDAPDQAISFFGSGAALYLSPEEAFVVRRKLSTDDGEVTASGSAADLLLHLEQGESLTEEHIHATSLVDIIISGVKKMCGVSTERSRLTAHIKRHSSSYFPRFSNNFQESQLSEAYLDFLGRVSLSNSLRDTVNMTSDKYQQSDPRYRRDYPESHRRTS